MRDKGKLLKKLIGPVFFLLLCALTFAALFGDGRTTMILPALRAMDMRFVLAAACAAVFFVAAEGFMLWELLHGVKETVLLSSCVRYSFVGFFYSGITPSATGGQPMQLYEMHQDGVRTGNATVALMSVATAYKFVLAVVAAGLLLFWRAGLEKFLAGSMPLFYLGLFLNALLVAILIGVMAGDGVKKLAKCAERALVRIRLLKPCAQRARKLDEVFENYRETVDFLRAHKGKIVLLTAFTFLQRASLFFLTWLIYRGMHLSGESVLMIMGLQAAVTICVDMLPLPGAQGITEVMYGVAFAGIFPEGLLLPSLCAVRGISFYFPLLVGAAASAYSRLRRKKGKKGVDSARGGVYDNIHTNSMYARGGRQWREINFRKKQRS